MPGAGVPSGVMAKRVTKADLGARYMTAAEVADYFATSTGHIYGLVNRREIPFTKVGARLRFKPEEIAEWAEANTMTPAQYRRWIEDLGQGR
jgi:excisionase family DNA binding protein